MLGNSCPSVVIAIVIVIAKKSAYEQPRTEILPQDFLPFDVLAIPVILCADDLAIESTLISSSLQQHSCQFAQFKLPTPTDRIVCRAKTALDLGCAELRLHSRRKLSQ